MRLGGFERRPSDSALAGSAKSATLNLVRRNPNFGLSQCVATLCTTTLLAESPFSVRCGFVEEPRTDLVNPRHRCELTVDGVAHEHLAPQLPNTQRPCRPVRMSRGQEASEIPRDRPVSDSLATTWALANSQTLPVS